ncbi:MAG: hypothetical protein JJ896_16525 [Rhodothermales bacterium]|nr:hypothetical protein [Rhodothermales bacterium]MBO6781263.1 hypothetical protein [Rhodothermales bacterium]
MSEGKDRTIRDETFRVRAYEAGPDGMARPDVLCNYLQEAAANHAALLGVSGEALAGMNLTWVLSRLVIEIEQFPAWQDTVQVRTWPAGLQGIFAIRDFELTASSGAVARATTAWFLIDTARRRPARLPEQVTGIQLPERARSLVDDFSRLPPVEDDGVRMPLVAAPSDMDLNQHVNHVRYLAWMLDSMESDWLDRHRLRRLQIQFRSESRAGDALVVRSAARSEFGWAHEVLNESGQGLSQAHSEWLPR